MRDPRLTKLAQVLVQYSVGVRKDHLVRISGQPIAIPLITELYREVLNAGGHPFVRLAPEELGEIMLKTASDEQIQFLNPVATFEVEKIDCAISIWAEENTRAMTNCDTRKMGLSQSARRPIMQN